MTADTYNPAKCRIIAAEIRSFDLTKRRSIANLITAFSISQSIESTSYRGTIRLLDNVGLLSAFPLRGEERLILKIDPGNQLGEIDLELQIYRIDNVNASETNDGVSYIAHFVSFSTYIAGRRKIIASYQRDSASQVVRKIFETYFSQVSTRLISAPVTLPFATLKFVLNDRQDLYVQPTVGLSDWLIPNYTPQEAMYFLMTRAYGGNETRSSSYRFFETLDGYHFVTDEFLIERSVNNDRYDGKQIKTLIYNPVTSQDPRNVTDQIFNIERLENQKRVDSAEDLHSGGYYNKVVEIDLLRRTLNTVEFNYIVDDGFIDTNGTRTNGQSSIHTDEYIRQSFTQENARAFNLYRDYTRNGANPSALNSEQHLAEIVSRRVAYQHHLNNTVVNASLKGRMDILPGDIVNIETADFTHFETRGRNQQLSGNYLVHSVNVEMEHEILNTVLKLVKYDWSV